MRCLIVEDEFTSRRILQRILQDFGEADVAVDGGEAEDAFCLALDEKAPYDAVFLDIMLPGMDGQQVLEALRRAEAQRGYDVGTGAKVIMTTSLSDATNVMRAFRGGCESYLVKPIERDKVVEELTKLGLLNAA
ncbi:MAG: response regulator [Myxococcales bacterium]|nr:response regulator [Myxococcales bacterium]MDD9971089.1 response regulator [Myxococcales bacterium]